MCDYSLMGIPSRLAVEGEQLVVYRFGTGSNGLASPEDLKPPAPPREQRRSFWDSLNSFFNPPESPPVCAVCVAPGTRLVLEDIPPSLQRKLRVGPLELVTFVESALAGSYRDAVRFKSNREVLLQSLCEGQHVWIMGLPKGEVSRLARVEVASRI